MFNDFDLTSMCVATDSMQDIINCSVYIKSDCGSVEILRRLLRVSNRLESRSTDPGSSCETSTSKKKDNFDKGLPSTSVSVLSIISVE